MGKQLKGASHVISFFLGVKRGKEQKPFINVQFFLTYSIDYELHIFFCSRINASPAAHVYENRKMFAKKTKFFISDVVEIGSIPASLLANIGNGQHFPHREKKD
jgi:hypothetical protein